MNDLEGTILNSSAEAPFEGVFQYWMRVRGTSWAPNVKDFRLDALEPKIIPWSSIVDVDTNQTDFKYRFWGTQRASLIGRELTGKMVSGINDDPTRNAGVCEYTEVVRQKKPMAFQTPITTPSGLRLVFSSIRLPLTTDGKTVSRIYTALSYLDVTKRHYDYFGTRSSTSVA